MTSSLGALQLELLALRQLQVVNRSRPRRLRLSTTINTFDVTMLPDRKPLLPMP